MIDKNNGIDFSVSQLKDWKNGHETWIRSQLNKVAGNVPVILNGEHHAEGIGNVTGLLIKRPAIVQPGTTSRASGLGNITATRIE